MILSQILRAEREEKRSFAMIFLFDDIRLMLILSENLRAIG